MFEKATRQKYRFGTAQGVLTVEDLWDLPLTSARGASLDNIARALSKEVKATGENESFVEQTQKADDSLQTKFEIVKHIIKVKLEDNAAARKAAENRATKEQLATIIARKQSAALEALSTEELLAKLNAL